ncbi:nucleotide sugar dehydrogenase [Methanococcoides sp. SA1]|nr:nucleotide sugar dehydrogenase [Methanococcoides sp. SA1]
MKICVMGLGYIGLPTALLLSGKHDVLGYDINLELVEKINNRILPFSEPGMDEAFFNSDMRASTKLEKSDVYIVCVPTPFDKEVKMAELRFVKNAVESLVPMLEKGNLVIIESTITPGTCEKIVTPIIERSGLKVGDDILLSHCPERAIPGKTFEEMVNNDRIVGGINEQSTEMTAEVYETFVKGSLYKTNARTAEFVKLMENTFRDVNIALANEFAILSEEVGIDVREAITYANKHPRVSILSPGPGVGGHCIAVDPWFLTENTINAKLIRSAREINDSMPSYVLSKAKKILKDSDIKNPIVTIFGVAYKANIGDTRETPALKLIKLCEKEGWDVRIYDPLVTKFVYALSSFEEAVDKSDLIIITVGHEAFGNLDINRISELMNCKNIMDTANILDVPSFEKLGFNINLLGV